MLGSVARRAFTLVAVIGKIMAKKNDRERERERERGERKKSKKGEENRADMIR